MSSKNLKKGGNIFQNNLSLKKNNSLILKRIRQVEMYA